MLTYHHNMSKVVILWLLAECWAFYYVERLRMAIENPVQALEIWGWRAFDCKLYKDNYKLFYEYI